MRNTRSRGRSGSDAVLDESAKLNQTAGTPYAGFLSWGLRENQKIAKELELLTSEGMAELKQGKSATITKGQYAGQKAEADGVIPVALCPELQNQVMNLELPPAPLKRAKSEKVAERTRVFAKELYEAKLLSEERWQKVKSCGPTRTPTTMQRNTQIVRYRSKNPILLVEVSADMGRTVFASNSRRERIVGIAFWGDNFLGSIPR